MWSTAFHCNFSGFGRHRLAFLLPFPRLNDVLAHSLRSLGTVQFLVQPTSITYRFPITMEKRLIRWIFHHLLSAAVFFFFFLILKYCKGISYFLSRHVHFLPIPSPQGGFVSFTICTSWIRPQSSSSVDGSSLFWFCYDFWWGNFAQRISVLLMNIWRWYHFITVK